MLIPPPPPPSPPQHDVPAHYRSIKDYGNNLGSGFSAHREMKDNSQRTKEGIQHEASRRDVPGEHYDVSPEEKIKNDINSGKYGEGFKVVENESEQSMEEEEEMSM